MPTEAELKKISREFRSRASQAARADFRGAPARIRRLLDYVERTPILREEIGRAEGPEEDPLETLEECREEGGRLDPPTDDMQHLGFLHALLQRMVAYADENGANDFWRLGDMYANKRGLNDGIEVLLSEVVGDYKEHLERRVVNAIIDCKHDRGAQREVRFHVVQHGGGQLNVAQDGSRIEATQGSLDGAADVVSATAELVSVAQSSTDLDPEVRSKLIGLASQVQLEFEDGDPDKSALEMIGDKIHEVTSLVASGTMLYNQAQLVAGKLAEFTGSL